MSIDEDKPKVDLNTLFSFQPVRLKHISLANIRETVIILNIESQWKESHMPVVFPEGENHTLGKPRHLGEDATLQKSPTSQQTKKTR